MGKGRGRQDVTYKRSKIQLIWTKLSCGLYGKVSGNIIREVCGYYRADMLTLVDLRANYMRIFSYKQRSWGARIPLKQEMVQGVSDLRWLSLLSDKVLCCGGKLSLLLGAISILTFLISPDGSVEFLSALSVPRYEHGLIEWKKTVIAFGGCKIHVGTGTELTVTCEQLVVQQGKQWERVASMQEGKCRFNPCLFNDVIYVCGFGSCLIEGFCPEKNLFVEGKVRIPQPNACLLYIEDNALVVHSTRTLVRFGLKRKLEGQLKPLDPNEMSWCSIQNSLSTPPVYDEDSNALHCVSDGKCYCLSLDSRTQTISAK